MLVVYLGIVVVGVGIVVCLFLLESQKMKQETILPVNQDKNPLLRNPPKDEYPIPIQSAQLSTPKETDESQALLEENLAKTAEISELNAKYEKLDKLFKEKNDEFEKIWKELDNETKNRKEFNKVKDLLEKEIKDLRDKNHKTQLELSAAQAESENFRKRASQLDDKINNKEKEIREKEKQIDDLAKRLQVFAQSKPAETKQILEPTIEPPAPILEPPTQSEPPEPEIASQEPPALEITPIEPASLEIAATEPLVPEPIVNEHPTVIIPVELKIIEPVFPEAIPIQPEPAPEASLAQDSGTFKLADIPELEEKDETPAEEEKPHLNLDLLKLNEEVTNIPMNLEEKKPDIVENEKPAQETSDESDPKAVTPENPSENK